MSTPPTSGFATAAKPAASSTHALAAAQPEATYAPGPAVFGRLEPKLLKRIFTHFLSPLEVLTATQTVCRTWRQMSVDLLKQHDYTLNEFRSFIMQDKFSAITSSPSATTRHFHRNLFIYAELLLTTPFTSDQENSFLATFPSAYSRAIYDHLKQIKMEEVIYLEGDDLGRMAFYNEAPYTSTPQERSQAISTYLTTVLQQIRQNLSYRPAIDLDQSEQLQSVPLPWRVSDAALYWISNIFGDLGPQVGNASSLSKRKLELCKNYVLVPYNIANFLRGSLDLEECNSIETETTQLIQQDTQQVIATSQTLDQSVQRLLLLTEQRLYAVIHRFAKNKMQSKSHILHHRTAASLSLIRRCFIQGIDPLSLPIYLNGSRLEFENLETYMKGSMDLAVLTRIFEIFYQNAAPANAAAAAPDFNTMRRFFFDYNNGDPKQANLLRARAIEIYLRERKEMGQKVAVSENVPVKAATGKSATAAAK